VVVLRCAEILDEAERSLHDALCILSQTVKNPKTVWGGGASEMLMSQAVENLVRTDAKFDEKDLTNKEKLLMATPGKEVPPSPPLSRSACPLPVAFAPLLSFALCSALLCSPLRAICVYLKGD
jgi:hypothetical protein